MGFGRNRMEARNRANRGNVAAKPQASAAVFQGRMANRWISTAPPNARATAITPPSNSTASLRNTRRSAESCISTSYREAPQRVHQSPEVVDSAEVVESAWDVRHDRDDWRPPEKVSRRERRRCVMIQMKRILVPTDFSEYSKLPVKYACAFAEMFGAELHVVHVLQDLVALVPEPGLAFLPPGDFLRELQESAQAALAKIPDADWARGKTIVRATRQGPPFLEIVRYAK